MVISNYNTNTQNDLCCIVIPVYKNKIKNEEITSLKQCCVVLQKHPIVFITHKKLDCAIYADICHNAGVSFKYEYFNKKYFSDIYGYNALLLSKIFYTRFNNYKYILIYQLDAYVFKDELVYWCNQNYDYIGAPWMSFNSLTEPPTFGNFYGLEIGNGGFSLRKTEAFIRLYSFKIWLLYLFFEIYNLFNRILKLSKKYFSFKLIRYIVFPPKIFFDRFYFTKREKYNEDMLWSKILQSSGKIPTAHIAAHFSFEQYCDHLFEVTDRNLPFGCHAWSEYYPYQLFWKNFIKL